MIIKMPFIFHFDEWAHLYCMAPEVFEEKRRIVIRGIIENIPQEERQRIEAIQFRIDVERSRAANPLSAAIRLNRLMWREFGKLNDALNLLVNGRPTFLDQTRPAGKVLPFRKMGHR